MKRHVTIGLIIAILGTAAAAYWLFLQKHHSSGNISFITEKITRGTVENTISSTGTLNPVGDVEVGTQISGTISKVYVDFNDTVQKDQLIAELDRTFLLSAYDEAKASLSRTRAQFELAKAEYERSKPLYDKKYLSEQEFAKVQTDYLTQKAALELANASVKKAKINLGYATIRSPISGTVIERSVEVGQTVSASLSAPTLFIIAENLANMEILASVDESDIGNIRQGQNVRFSVQAYPDRQYEGTVSQIRLQPETIQNVVTYTVVVNAKNPDGSLLPGMTATLDFIQKRVDNTLIVPAAALRFNPPQNVIDNINKLRDSSQDSGKGDQRRFHSGSKNDGPGEKKAEANQSRKRGPDGMTVQNRGMIWLLQYDKSIKPVFVKPGISDGVVTEIHEARGINLKEGLQVVVGINSGSDKKNKKSLSLFPQPGGIGGRRR